MRLVAVAVGIAVLSACTSGREMACQCVGADVLVGNHPADDDYGTCAESRLTCWVTTNESESECTEDDEALEQESICCTGDDCACTCTDEGPIGS